MAKSENLADKIASYVGMYISLELFGLQIMKLDALMIVTNYSSFTASGSSRP
jgi:hypothetical protein